MKELANRTFNAMKHSPLIGNRKELLVNDIEKISLSLQEEEEIKSMYKDEFKKNS